MYDVTENEGVDDYIEHLIIEGALVLQTVDEFGEPIFAVDVERMKEVAPEYLDAHYRGIEDSLVSLFEKGLVEFDVDESGELAWSLTEEGEHFAQTQNLDNLP